MGILEDRTDTAAPWRTTCDRFRSPLSTLEISILMPHLKRRLSHCLVVGTLLLAACNSAPQTDFQEFSSEAGGFSISTPAIFEENQQSLNTPAGPIDVYTFTVEENNADYIVAYSDYPSEMVEATDPEAMLDGNRDGALRNLQGEVLSEETVSIDGNPGRSLTIDAFNAEGEPSIIDFRIFLVDNRLYQIIVVSPKDQETPSNADQFLESFALN